MEDTVVLGRKYIPDLKKYKLANLTRYFNIVNQSAHRGIYDALATAEVFIRLAELMDNAQKKKKNYVYAEKSSKNA